MPGTCLYSWQTDASEPTVACIWRSSDYVERAIFLGLALMLAYTVFVVGRFWQRYYLSRSEIRRLTPDDFPGIRRATLNFIAEMCPAIAMLRGIASSAPFLGLAGTCYAFLAGFYRIGSGSRASALAATADMIANAPTPTLAGILVAIPAAFFYNSLRTHIERMSNQVPSCTIEAKGLGSFQSAQTLPLKARFSRVPPYALVAAPFLACAVMSYLAFKVHPGPMGLSVSLPRIGTLEGADHSLNKIVISVSARKNDIPLVRINSEEVPWDRLVEVVGRKIEGLVSREVSVEADPDIDWANVAYVIDSVQGFHCRAILLTTRPQGAEGRLQGHRPKFPIARPKPLR